MSKREPLVVESPMLPDGAQRLSLDRFTNGRIDLDPENVRNGLGKLVLTLVELIRELLERQAIRRMDSGTLTAEEIERLGTTFLRLSEQMDHLKRVFGLENEELNLDLGPLGRLL